MFERLMEKTYAMCLSKAWASAAGVTGPPPAHVGAAYREETEELGEDVCATAYRYKLILSLLYIFDFM